MRLIVPALLAILCCQLAAARFVAAASPLTGTMTAIDGSPVDLASFDGKVVLVVNVASRCGATPQYAGLQKLYDTYKDRGLVVLGFPANDFLGQEPGTDAQIADFCSSKYHVTFPMFSKITVKGANMPPLYKTLTESADPPGAIGWNFEKFLIGRNGAVVGRFKTRVAPDDPALITAVEAALAAK
jgi:glutathione peroxidase